MVDFEPREHSIQADLGLLKEARDFAERAAEDFGLDGAACYDVKLAMSEAVTNAIQHGSSSPSDPIRIVVRGGGRRARVRGARHRPLPPARDAPRRAARVAAAGSSSCGVLMDEVDLQAGRRTAR